MSSVVQYSQKGRSESRGLAKLIKVIRFFSSPRSESQENEIPVGICSEPLLNGVSRTKGKPQTREFAEDRIL